MNELVPIVGGLLLGLAVFALPSRWRLVAGVLGVLLLGVLATVVSGEFLVSWAFLLFDVPLAAAATLAGYLGARQLSARAALRGHGENQTREPS